MKTKTSLLLLTLTTTLGLSGPVVAAHLAAPDGLVCSRGFDNSVHSRWDNLDDASYYAVDVTAEYDVSGDGQMDRAHAFHFGSRDTELVLEKGDLMGSFVDDDGQVVQKTAKAASLRVTATHLGKGHEIGKGHEKAIGEGHHKTNGSARNADYSECKVALDAPREAFGR